MQSSKSHLPRLSLALALFLPLLLLLMPAQGEASKRAGASAKRGASKAALIELGRRLFFDPLVSRTGRRSCASCHDPKHGFGDASQFSEDDVGTTLRHSQTLVDTVHSTSAHWDGEFGSIEELVSARIGRSSSGNRAVHRGLLRISRPDAPNDTPSGGGGYGDSPPSDTPPADTPPVDVPDSGTTDRPLPPNHEDVTPPDAEGRKDAKRAARRSRLAARLDTLDRAQDKLEDSDRYAEAVKAAFGDRSITRARVAKAIGAYCRTITSTSAPFDRRGDPRELQWNEDAQRGYELFKGRAGCAQCHVLTPVRGVPRRVIFSNSKFHNTGIAWIDKIWNESGESPKHAPARLRLLAHSLAPSPSKRAGVDDIGRARISTRRSDTRSFKTPPLRDVASRSPYMHNGMFSSLHDVVRYYARGGSADPLQDKRIKPFDASEKDVDDLVAFMHTLTSSVRPRPCDRLLSTPRA